MQTSWNVIAKCVTVSVCFHDNRIDVCGCVYVLKYMVLTVMLILPGARLKR